MEPEEFLASCSIETLQAAYRSGDLTVHDVVSSYLDRIASLNPVLGAVICTSKDALAEAQSRDAASDFSLPLAGIPILIKDNIETKEMPTTAGSLALKDNFTGRDAPVVSALRGAGAIILGKTNLSEWANFRARKSTSGWSAVGGQARNPHHTDYSPSGSSSGSAVAVAANLCLGAIGTETLGSIISPAAACGVVGIKPSVDLLSQQYIVPISHSQDTAGPMARSIEDAARILGCMGGQITSAESPTSLRLGIIRGTTGFKAEVDRLFHTLTKKVRTEGSTLVQDLVPGVGFDIMDHFLEMAMHEFKYNLNLYLAGLPNHCRSLSLDSLIAFNRDTRAERVHFGQDIFEAAQDRGSLTEAAYLDAVAQLHPPTRNALDRLFSDYQLDAIIAPTMGPIYPIDYKNGDGRIGGGITIALAAIAGYPHITLPMGIVDGLPIGLSLMGPKHGDSELIGIATQFERMMGKADPLLL